MKISIRTAGIFCVVAFLLGSLLMCKYKAGNSNPIIYYTDTIVKVIPDSATHQKPQPVQTVPPQMAKVRVDSFIQYEYLPVDSAAIVAQYKALYEQCASEHTYRESYAFNDGKIEVESVVQGNELMSQTVRPTFYQTTITRTTQAKPKNSVWIGVDGLYSSESIGAGASLQFQSKRGWAIGAGGALNLNGVPQYRLSFNRKISL